MTTKMFTVIMRWNELKQRWDCLLKATGLFVMDFPDCATMHLLSDNLLERHADNEYQITLIRGKGTND